MLAIAVCAFGKLSIFGFSIKNILSILIVLILGWKNGVLVGTTSGVTIGVTLGVITSSEPVMVAAYAISGMISGILNKFGKNWSNNWILFRKYCTCICFKWIHSRTNPF